MKGAAHGGWEVCLKEESILLSGARGPGGDASGPQPRPFDGLTRNY